MKHLLISISLVVFLLASTSFAQDSLQVQNRKQFRQKGQQHSLMKNRQGQGHMGFVDENGDGYNDNAPDADGDGIPNGMDPDYTGPKMHNGNGSRGFVDADGDGINDNAMDDDGDGIPNGQDPDFVRPQDGSGRMNGQGKGKGRHGNGSGIGSGSGNGSGSGSGDCDGTGPKGKRGGK